MEEQLPAFIHFISAKNLDVSHAELKKSSLLLFSFFFLLIQLLHAAGS